MMKVGIRADGSTNIGMGHIMRCLSLAKGFRNAGIDVYFFSKFEQGIQKIREEGFEVIELPHHSEIHSEGLYYGDVSSLKDEADEIIRRLNVHNPDILFIDSYNVTEEFFLKLKPYVKKLCYIDDNNRFTYPVDVLINGNITGESLGYKRYYEDEILMLGVKYNLIRDEFKYLPERIVNREVKEIMITTGGSDPFELSLRLAGAIIASERFEGIVINIVAGSGFTNLDSLRDLVQKNANIVIHENVSKMSELMLKSDLAITAGGSTLYELCACGTPALAFIIAENQKQIVDMLSDKGYIQSLGWHNEFADLEFLKALELLCKDYEGRVSLSKKMQKLVDGEGVRRIVDELVRIFS
ncbi:MAG: UDP-2,4-diacetamido-2,4,6-trideoxy-beta-L-altropyranose hydrolase [bacterium ADurb.Bin363]|nr:MAG: UDP-2,4-diacetamido-2,4,6-trideoxy-beta-L-altropyranose hydrolase [bacterium ADurb.Bin363]